MTVFDYDQGQVEGYRRGYADGRVIGRQAQLKPGSDAERHWRQRQYELMRAGNCAHAFDSRCDSGECVSLCGATPINLPYALCPTNFADCPLTKNSIVVEKSKESEK